MFEGAFLRWLVGTVSCCCKLAPVRPGDENGVKAKLEVAVRRKREIVLVIFIFLFVDGRDFLFQKVQNYEQIMMVDGY